MKSFYGILGMATLAFFVFAGMLNVFVEAPLDSQQNADNKALFDTLTDEYNEVNLDKVNVTQVELGIQNEDAFAAEFYSASTDSQKKAANLNTMKDVPNLIRYTIGQEDSFGWAYDIAMTFIVAVVFLIGFVIIFKREVFN